MSFRFSGWSFVSVCLVAKGSYEHLRCHQQIIRGTAFSLLQNRIDTKTTSLQCKTGQNLWFVVFLLFKSNQNIFLCGSRARIARNNTRSNERNKRNATQE